MSLFAKLSISLVITVIASALTTTLFAGETISFLDMRLTLSFFVVTVATAILVGSMAAPSRAAHDENVPLSGSDDTDREMGTVKWFNVSKGFGFIVRENGEEIFVHFRSIRGEGRRSLRDGQSVSFVVAQSDKGPQAEDVIGED